MWDYNHLAVQGRVTKDAKLETSADGRKWCRFCIASNFPIWNKDQNKAEEGVSFFEAVVFGEYASRLYVNLKKGRHVLLVGELRQHKWTDAKGVVRSEMVIRTEKVNVEIPRESQIPQEFPASKLNDGDYSDSAALHENPEISLENDEVIAVNTYGLEDIF